MKFLHNISEDLTRKTIHYVKLYNRFSYKDNYDSPYNEYFTEIVKNNNKNICTINEEFMIINDVNFISIEYENYSINNIIIHYNNVEEPKDLEKVDIQELEKNNVEFIHDYGSISIVTHRHFDLSQYNKEGVEDNLNELKKDKNIPKKVLKIIKEILEMRLFAIIKN